MFEISEEYSLLVQLPFPVGVTSCIFSIVLKMESPVICPIVFHDVVLGEAKQLTHSFWGEFCFVLRTVKLQLHILHSLQQHQSQTKRLTIITMNINELILAPPSSAFSMRAEKEASRSRSMETPSRRTFKDESSALLLSHSRPLPNAESAFMSPFFTSRPGHFMTTPPSVHRRSTSNKRMRISELCNEDGEVFPHLLIPIFDDFSSVLDASEVSPPRVPYKLSIRPQRLSELDSFAPVEDSSTVSSPQCVTEFQQINVYPGKISRWHSGGNAVAA